MLPNDLRINLLASIARTAPTREADAVEGDQGDSGRPASILSLAAASYGARPTEDSTVPTGFDPLAVALFEAIVEAAFLVANADGVFDDEERRAFERVVVAACGGTVSSKQIAALVSDLNDQLQEDGMQARLRVIGVAVRKREHALEVLRVAAVLAQASADVSPVERKVLEEIAAQCRLAPRDVDAALKEVEAALKVA